MASEAGAAALILATLDRVAEARAANPLAEVVAP